MALRRPGGGSSTPPPPPIERDIVSSAQYIDQNNQQTLMGDTEGVAWVVDYFNQLLADGEEPRILDSGLDATLQQYCEILDCRLFVDEEVNFEADALTGTYTTTGRGRTFPNSIIPIVGDMFLGSVTTDQKGNFTITSVQALGIYKNPVYEVEYKLHALNDEVLEEELRTKVAQYFYFDNKRAQKGEQPLVTYERANQDYNYRQVMYRMVTYLYDTYYDPELKTFLFQGELDRVYDPMACEFFNSITSRQVRGRYPTVAMYSDGGALSYIRRPTIWRALLRRTNVNLGKFQRDINDVGPRTLSSLEMWYTLAVSGIPLITHTSDWKLGTVAPEAPYVLSNDFYDNLSTKSLLETLVYATISREPVTDTDINTEIAAWEVPGDTTSDRQQFYRTILLLCILTYKMGSG